MGEGDIERAVERGRAGERGRERENNKKKNYNNNNNNNDCKMLTQTQL